MKRVGLVTAALVAAVAVWGLSLPSRRTVLSHRGASVEMVEHIMAALSGLGVDNCDEALKALQDLIADRFGEGE